MGTGHFRGAAIAALCVAAALVSGCGGGGAGPELIAGRWFGALTLSFTLDGSVAGALALELDQEEAFASGIAQWSPVEDALSVAVPIDGDEVVLRLNFRCTDPDTGTIRNQTAAITGTLDGSTMTFTGASGLACLGLGVPLEISGGSGAVTRTTDNRPL